MKMRTDCLGLCRQLDTGYAWHDDVRKEQINARLRSFDDVERVLRISSCKYSVACLLQYCDCEFAQRLIVLHHQG